MPGFDRTGPMGHGPGTGGGRGFCYPGRRAGYAPGTVYGVGRFGIPYGGGRGRAFGGGRAWYSRTNAPYFGPGYGPEPYAYGESYPYYGDEREFLKEQIKILEGQLKDLSSRLEELSTSEEK